MTLPAIQAFDDRRPVILDDSSGISCRCPATATASRGPSGAWSSKMSDAEAAEYEYAEIVRQMDGGQAPEGDAV